MTLIVTLQAVVAAAGTLIHVVFPSYTALGPYAAAPSPAAALLDPITITPIVLDTIVMLSTAVELT